MDWTLSDFTVVKLLDGSAFPAFSAQELQLYDINGDIITGRNGSNALYLPYVDFDCLVRMDPNFLGLLQNFSNTVLNETYVCLF